MNSNEAPIDVLHKSRLFSVILVLGFVIFLWLAVQVKGGLGLMLALGAGGYLLYFLFFEIQKIEIFRTYLSIRYRCLKVRVERSDIDNVSIGRTNQTSVSTVTGRYIMLRLKSGRRITLGNLRESADVVYEKLKAFESNNEEISLEGDNSSAEPRTDSQFRRKQPGRHRH